MTDIEGPRDGVARIDALASGFQEAQVLMTGVRLGLFAALDELESAGDGADAATLAGRLGASPRGVRILCDALAALEVLDKQGERYTNTPAARAVLLPGAPRSKVARMLHGARLYERWAKLIDAVESGSPVPDDAIDPRLASDERSFARAMADVARESAVETAEALAGAGALEGVERILDVGGGPGHYAVEIVRRAPEARAVVLDRPETLEVARETIDREGLSDRIATRAGDAFEEADLRGDGEPFDLIFTSNLIHIYPEEANRRLVAHAAASLAPGGSLAIKDFLLDGDRTSPPGGALFAVNMLVSTDGGDCYTVEQVHRWFEEHGLAPGATLDLTPKSRLSLATKPR